MNNCPILKNHQPVLVAPVIPSHPINNKRTWQTTLRELELKYNNWRNTFATTEMGMEDVNELMQDLYPGPYRVVEKYLPARLVFGFELEFGSPKEKTLWLLKNS